MTGTNDRLNGLPQVMAPADADEDSRRLALGFAMTRDAELAYVTHPTMVGELLLVTSRRGVMRMAFTAVSDADAVLEDLAHRVSPRILRQPPRLDDVRRALDAYFAGERREVGVAIDLVLAHGFRREVLDHLRAVPAGSSVSYGELAAASGRPRAVRAAASACATNPVPIVVPCHRVVRSDGSLGGYLGGLPVKRALLDLEALDTSHD